DHRLAAPSLGFSLSAGSSGLGSAQALARMHVGMYERARRQQMEDQLQALISTAGAAAAAGRWQEAERLWSQVRTLDPGNVQALFSLGAHAFQRGDMRASLELLQAARARAPHDPMLPLTVSRVFRELGQS